MNSASIATTALLQVTSGVRPTACPDGTAFGVPDQTQKEEAHTQTLKRASDIQTVRQSDTQRHSRGVCVFLFSPSFGDSEGWQVLP